jgi:signal peptidase II
MNRARLIGFAIAFALFVLDQAVKAYVTGTLGLDTPGDALTVLPIFDLRFVQNIGVSLGMLAADSEPMRWGLVALTGAIAAGVAYWMVRENNRTDLIALGMVLGGALGNILDRVRFGYVVDYADLHFGTWQPFLVFNVADAAITIGVLILLARALFVRDKPAPRESSNA